MIGTSGGNDDIEFLGIAVAVPAPSSIVLIHTFGPPSLHGLTSQWPALNVL
ncbi:hypothetical protein [Echinimonas agarilytica]|uniref:Uncharacterized protein n=1 Tax=Echinimonas agarilytica TaxID=1215918 RepID=A0AA41W8V5_9GAMM|nr:hypothetical protein [Echinimonas agarilytica]MCM2681180.1 hypothetical protein [Echinimonas agarilytica]